MSLRALAGMALLPALFLAGCGGGGDKTQSRSEVIQKANAICRQATADARAYTTGRASPEGAVQVRAALQKDVDIAKATVTKLDALDPAEEQKADFDHYVSGVKAIADGNQRFIQAIGNGDTAGVKAGSDAAVQGAAQAKKGADAYGLDDCPAQTVSALFAQQQKDKAQSIAAAQDPIGSWSGRVTQFGPGSRRAHYRAFMTVRDVNTLGARAGTVNYPAFPCAGDIRLVARRANRFTFLEHITAHPATCPSGGRISTAVNSGTMAWRWVRKDIVVLGTLHRG